MTHAFPRAGSALAFLTLVAHALAAAGAPSIGNIDEPRSPSRRSASPSWRWALNRAGIERIELVIDGRRHRGAAASSATMSACTYPDNANPGFEAVVDLSNRGPITIDVVVTDHDRRGDGAWAFICRRIPRTWAALLAARTASERHVLLRFDQQRSRIREQIDKVRAVSERPIRVGVRVPISTCERRAAVRTTGSSIRISTSVSAARGISSGTR
jgi:hypothetical protein